MKASLKTTKSILGILILTAGLTVLSCGCGKKADEASPVQQTSANEQNRATPQLARTEQDTNVLLQSSSSPTPPPPDKFDSDGMPEMAGLIGPFCSRLTNTNLTESQLKDLLKKASRLEELAAQFDLRVLQHRDDPRPTISEWPVAYVPFGRSVPFSVDNFFDQFGPNVRNGFEKGLKADGVPDVTVSRWTLERSFGKVCHVGKSQSGRIQPCNAIGLAVCEGISGKSWTRMTSLGDSPEVLDEDACQGFWIAYDNRATYFLLIEDGSPLHKWIESAPYYTNLLSKPAK